LSGADSQLAFDRFRSTMRRSALMARNTSGCLAFVGFDIE